MKAGQQTGWCIILIYSDTVSVDEISRIMQVKPTSAVTKGNVVSKRLNSCAIHNGWFYKREFDNLDSVDETMQHVVKVCFDAIDRLRKVEDLDVRIRCFVNSDLAQVGYSLSSETIKLLSKIDKGLEITLFSCGGIEDE